MFDLVVYRQELGGAVADWIADREVPLSGGSESRTSSAVCLVRSCRSCTGARSLNVAKCMCGQVGFVAVDHFWGEIGIVV